MKTFILKQNSHIAIPLACYRDVKLFETIGVQGIKKLKNAKAILTRLVNSNYLPEGNY
tara:strand:- start:179 stop:352 length:174 start_codon:yes stop_codon:yes gene_type:complete